ncbi:Nuclear pore complex protein NUP107 [Camellia lanceoleosa]|uniref:Nuclear pore complex protein NUP107 n=1 Tax=Camellia lanceoleosa TaxID=1840588 RepID=A0ACC0ISQ2_9ERIC|nr:Nuclear pore complex protein NUP107 [Camellia lanceoleosa]
MNNIYDSLMYLTVDILCITGLMPIPDLILQFERSCRNVSESIRYGSNERHRIVEDKLMRRMLDSYLMKLLLGNEELPEDMMLVIHLLLLTLKFSIMFSCSYIVRGSHVGTYLPSSRVWRHTQRALKKGVSKPKTVHHLDFDAPTRNMLNNYLMINHGELQLYAHLEGWTFVHQLKPW